MNAIYSTFEVGDVAMRNSEMLQVVGAPIDKTTCPGYCWVERFGDGHRFTVHGKALRHPNLTEIRKMFPKASREQSLRILSKQLTRHKEREEGRQKR